MSLQDDDRLILGCVYRSADSREEDNTHFVEGLINTCQMNFTHVFIAGDFNYPEIDWSTGGTAFGLDHKA